MLDRDSKMLDFPGSTSEAQDTKQRPDTPACPLEQVNVAARIDVVKHLFVNQDKDTDTS